jgi:hypothetical protein
VLAINDCFRDELEESKLWSQINWQVFLAAILDELVSVWLFTLSPT